MRYQWVVGGLYEFPIGTWKKIQHSLRGQTLRTFNALSNISNSFTFVLIEAQPQSKFDREGAYYFLTVLIGKYTYDLILNSNVIEIEHIKRLA
jgi:hypothetical protein